MVGSDWLLGMTTHAEQSYFEEYARDIYLGTGAIVDLGCWLGSTTIALAKGLAENPSPQARASTIHAFDRFVWEAWMGETSCCRGTEIEGKFKPGESFLDEFHKRTAPWSDRIQVYTGDLCQIGWGGAPIEFLLIDAMKSWELANGILRDFYPCLIPGKSYILHQDFAHFYEPWIHLTHYRLRDYFRVVHIVPHSQSFVFEYVKKLPDELLTASYEPSLFSDEEVDVAFEYSISLTSDRETRTAIAASKVMHFIHVGDTNKAQTELDAIVSQGLPITTDLQNVLAQLNQST
jgi:hypothetical protein